MSDGDGGAADELLPVVYDELHRIADRLMGRERVGHTLQPTALINEAFVRLSGARAGDWEGREHFLRVAARAMRSVLTDHARAASARKRKGSRDAVTLNEQIVSAGEDSEQVLLVHEGIELLAEIDAQLSSIVELRFFGGLSNRETAEVLGCSQRSVERGWQFARAFLRQHFGGDG
jgi:RNA polymerase sigma-70 factor (ECF subfamily)